MKKSFNVSLQSKKYYQSVNDILSKWEKENISTEVCESMLMYDKFNKVLPLINVQSAISTIEKMLSIQNIPEELKERYLEDVLSEVVYVDVNKILPAIKHITSESLTLENQRQDILKEKTVEPKITPQKLDVKVSDRDILKTQYVPPVSLNENTGGGFEDIDEGDFSQILLSD